MVKKIGKGSRKNNRVKEKVEAQEQEQKKDQEQVEYLHPKAAIRKKLESLILNLLDGALDDSLDFANLTTKAAVARIAVDYLKLEGGDEEIPSIFADLHLPKTSSPNLLEEEIESIQDDLNSLED